MAKIVFEEMVAGLAKDGDLILSELSPVKAHLLHMAVGTAGEFGELLDAISKPFLFGDELDTENVREELGDAEFYLEGLRQGFGLDPIELGSGIYIFPKEHGLLAQAIRASVTSCDLLDSVKKGVIYNKPFDMETIKDQLSLLDAVAGEIYRKANVSKEQAIEANIEKLGKRYEGHKYSDQAAQTRADKN